MAIPQQSDIIWAVLNPHKGHEQKEHRPMIVLSSNVLARLSNVVFVASISNISRQAPNYVNVPDEIVTVGTILLDLIAVIDYAARNAVI